MVNKETMIVFIEDVDKNDKISKIILYLNILILLSNNKPVLILYRQKKCIIVVYNNNDLKLMEFELLKLLNNKEKRETVQFTN